MDNTCDEYFMRRCLQLARNGRQLSRPNPMVGAVIVDSQSNRILGEGYHVRCGEGHAEVNAFASVSTDNEALLPQSTMYVSLEPCAHYGKTPPCCDLIISKGVRRVVVGCVDDFAKVQGRGIERMRAAGIEVKLGVLEQECRWINRRFFTFHSQQRPYIILKWAQTADGFLDDHYRAIAISTPHTAMLSHRLRAMEDAIVVGRTTDSREHPQLTTRRWNGPSPRRFVLGGGFGIPELMDTCLHDNLQSLIVEGGAATHARFLAEGLWDELRIETGTMTVGAGTAAPLLPPNAELFTHDDFSGNILRRYIRKKS